MSFFVDASHDAGLESWVEAANDPASDFPIQNLPFGRFRRDGDSDWRIGVAIGDEVLDLRAAGLIDNSDMNRLIRLLPEARAALRRAISDGLKRGSSDETRFAKALVPQAEVRLGLPCRIGDYTDFYVSSHHATAIGRIFRPDNPLLPNYKWVPFGYHGRASSINASPSGLRRPMGQRRGAEGEAPQLLPTAKLDFELELGLIVGRPNAQGEPIGIERAEEHLFGVTLFNDWTARDIQSWEYQPLGPFLSKNFASTISPWTVSYTHLTLPTKA